MAVAIPIKIQMDLLETINNSRALYAYCLSSKGDHTEAGIEAAFLQMFKAWEAFLEECCIAFLCGRLSCNGSIVESFVKVPGDGYARELLLGGEQFVGWGEPEEVLKRVKRFFPSPNQIERGVASCMVDLRHMVRIRNVIAHASRSAEMKFGDLVQSKFGGKRRMRRASEFLEHPDVDDANRTYFDRYASVLETCAFTIAGRVGRG